MSAMDLGPGIVLEGADGHSVSLEGADRRRSMNETFVGDQFADAIDQALITADFTIDADARIAPERRPSRRRDIAASGDAPQMQVKVEAGQAAVLLIENADGVYHWQFPKSDKKFGSARRSAGAETLTFSLTEPVNQERSGDGRRGIGSALGWLGEVLIEPIRVRVLRYAAAKTIDAAVAKIEGDVPSGLVWLDGSSEQWQVTDKQPPAPSVKKNVLLMVHGTFSTTMGSFAALDERLEGDPSFLDIAREQYDLVLGVDHKTLALDPEQNAKDILEALDFVPDGTTIDAVAFSRGGLVYRTLSEHLARKKRPNLNFNKAVFVGCTNSGTYLANPENWEDLVGLYTNIGLAGARALGFFGSPIAGRIATEVVKLLGGFVQALPELAIKDRQVPGLAAMEPDGTFVEKINAGKSPLDRYHAIASDFEPRPGGGNGLTGGVAGYLADRVMDRLLKLDNDLVVHTASMTSFGPDELLPEDVVQRFQPSDAVYHTVYFQSPKVPRWLGGWLFAPKKMAATTDDPDPTNGSDNGGSIVGSDSGGSVSIGPPAAASAPPKSVSDSTGGTSRIGSRRGPGDSSEGVLRRAIESEGMKGVVPSGVEFGHFEESAAEESSGAPELASAGEEVADKPIDAEPRSAPYFFAAEMAATPPVGVTPLSVVISREMIRVAAHAAAQAAKEAVDVDLFTDISISVMAKENCKILAGQPDMIESETNAWVEVDVPVPANSEHVRFLVEGEGGKALVQVDITQGPASLASFTLEPYFIDFDLQRLSQQQSAFSMQPSAEYPMVLKIFELGSDRSGHVIKYDLVSKDPKFVVKEEIKLKPGFSAAIYSKDLIEAFNEAHGLSRMQYKTALRNLSAASLNATNELLPESIRAKLAEHWDKVKAIQVFSENSHLPWELLSVKREGAPRGETSFLAERGLVRWVFNVNPPGNRIPIRDNTARFVIPDYLNDAHDLEYAESEKAMFRRLFKGASPAGSTSDEVSTFLDEQAHDCDVLHFTCHGDTSHSSVMSADLYMEGFKREDGRGVDNDTLSADVAKEWASFADEDEARTLVFVNACRAGETGNSIAGTTGFAEAFLNPNSKRGAAAFVGALWKIDDKFAFEFAEEFYTAMMKDGEKLIDAAQRARFKLKERPTDFTWLAYTIYGNPMARFVKES